MILKFVSFYGHDFFGLYRLESISTWSRNVTLALSGQFEEAISYVFEKTQFLLFIFLFVLGLVEMCFFPENILDKGLSAKLKVYHWMPRWPYIP